jgi:putative heme-binding domain-containing protein
VKNIAFDFKDRSADHTTNGLSLGADGWLYIAGGDFAFMKATGADGTTLQHRAGGVIRVRPDGSGLEIYATGTRNILEVAISPEMDMFARDNTNDGGGWNVRFHHFTGLGDYGYPRLYKNFADELIAPIADYGGGSGCGAVFIDEPGFGDWNNAPFTCDWGTGALYRQNLKVKGATFEETEKPKPFIQMTRPTDGDVDASSRVYQASWKGATFNWEGPDVGYIVQVKPKGFQAEPLPDFEKSSNSELVKLLESPSNRRRLEAQRTLIRRGLPDEILPALTQLIADPTKLIGSRAAALLAFTHFPDKGKAVAAAIQSLAPEPAFDALVARGSAETADWIAKKHNGDFTIPEAWKTEPATLAQLNRLVSNSTNWNAKTRKAIFDLTLGSTDSMVSHTAIQSLVKLGDHALAFQYVDAAAAPGRADALNALARMHQPEVVDGLIERLGKTKDFSLRTGLISSLSRLHFHEGEWKGDSWGTRPDTRGPYYQPEPWSETPKVLAALKQLLASASPEEAAFLIKEMNRNRIQSSDALNRILTLAKEDAKLMPEAVAQLAAAETVPADAVPLLLTAVRTDPRGMEPTMAATLLMNAIVALTKTDSAEGCVATLPAIVALTKTFGADREKDAARAAFFGSPKLENYEHLLEAEAEKVGTPPAQIADAALLSLSVRTTGSPESKELSTKALDLGWQTPKRREQILRAVTSLKFQPYADKIIASLDDPDKGVAAAALSAANTMKLKRKSENSGPLIGTLKTEDVIAQVLKTKGDVALGEQLFSRASCITCHTTKESEAQKGPYLGNIAQTYKRPELAENILDPNKTVAQGFVTNLITTKDGKAQMGFVTFESAEKVKLRDVTSKEFTFETKDIATREKLPNSMMPPGLMNNLTVQEFASLLDYLESLSK